MSKSTNEANWYGTTFKAWAAKAKLLGPKPTADMLANVHNLGARPGKQALAIAMGLRDGGVTGAQIVMACGAPQLNKMRGFITDALLKREATPPSAEGHTVYKLVVTPKGKQRIERTVKANAAKAADGEAVDKPVKAAGKGKGAAKTKAKPVTPQAETPTSEAGSGTTGQADSQQQPQA